MKRGVIMNGNKLRALREKKGLLQKELANEIGISTSTIGMYEQGRREPDFETVKKLANYFGVSIDYLADNESKLFNDDELKEKEILKHSLINAGYMKENEDLSDEELQKLMKFIKNNKEFIKD